MAKLEVVRYIRGKLPFDMSDVMRGYSLTENPYRLCIMW